MVNGQWSIFILFAALSLQASAFTETPVDQAPDWNIDWTYNQPRPDWQAPSASDYVSFSVMIIDLEEELQPYASKDDMLAIFVGEECRGIASPAYAVANETTPPSGGWGASSFVLKAFSNESNGDVIDLSLKYYCARLNHIFTCNYTFVYDDDEVFGTDEDFVPSFTHGSPKFPIVTPLNFSSVIRSGGIDPDEGDMVAVFVGDECRGTSSIFNLQSSMVNGQWSMITAYGRESREHYTLKYYDADESLVITFTLGKLPMGDVNGDGVVDVADISSILTFMAGGNGGVDISDADINNDGKVDVADIATVITKMADGQ